MYKNTLKEGPMGSEVRRVVTRNEADGKAVVLLDGASPRIMSRPESGIKSALLWVTDTTPAEVTGTQDRADRAIGIPPPTGGSVFRIVDFYPVDDSKLPADHMTQHMGTDASRKGWAPRHPAMHRTRSVDYAIVMSGEIDMLLDDSEIHLKAGDVLVQQSTNHAWVNRGTEPCRIAFVLIDAKED
jgi:mannose-6-phosphate isomerase-like protein (cupin superfamily)